MSVGAEVRSAMPSGCDDSPRLAWHSGQCHCGAVRFDFSSDLVRGVRCNCSYCVRKASLHHRVKAEFFILKSGADELSVYRFGTLRANHYFCRHCGIHTHCNPRSAPEQVNVNLNCVDQVAMMIPAIEVSAYDGRSWLA